MNDVIGVTIKQGISDWQVFQQDTDGTADIAMSGLWGGAPTGTVELRLVREEDSVPVATHLNWQPAVTKPDGSWTAVLKKVPAGGLYRLETHLQTDPKAPTEWQIRGDMRHFIGVGELWIIAGQSNSSGYGRGPAYDPPELGIHIFNNAMKWALATQPLNESTDTVHPENREGGNSGHGPWMHFARLIRRQINVPVGLVQVSLGGSPLSSWNPTDPGDHPLYELLIRAHKAVGEKIRGILWYQGESETGTTESAFSHENRFIAAVEAWRKAMKQPDLHVLTVQLGHWMGDAVNAPDVDLRWTIMRETQRRIPQRLRNVTVSPTLDLTLSDGIHVAPFSNMLLAQRVAQAALATVYKKDVHYLAPQPKHIRNTKEDIIEIEFENVVGRMDSINPWAVPFRIEDDQGTAEIKKVEYTGTAVIRLHLERPLSGKAVVHGAYGYDPAVAPMDMDRAIPMLGFYGFPIEQ